MPLQRWNALKTINITTNALLGTTTLFATSTSACFVEPGQSSSSLTDSHATVTSLGQTILERRFAEFPLFDVSGKQDSVGRVVYGVSREETGTLNFFYRFVNYTPENIGIESIQVSGFGDVLTEVQTLSDDDHQMLPHSALRSATGSQIDFEFDPAPIEPGAKSATLLIRTNATAYDQNGALSLQAIGSSRFSPETTYTFEDAQLKSFSPAAAPHTVPLPAPIWTGLAGLAATVVYVLKHKQVV